MDSAHTMAKEMKSQVESYFRFLLNKKDKDFLPVYWVASFLCPIYRFVISSEELPVVRSYLESKFSVFYLYISDINVSRCCVTAHSFPLPVLQ